MAKRKFSNQQKEKIMPKRDSLTAIFMRDITDFHTKTGMKYPSIGRKAIQDPRLWERLQNGGTITLKKADQVYDWMAVQGYHY